MYVGNQSKADKGAQNVFSDPLIQQPLHLFWTLAVFKALIAQSTARASGSAHVIVSAYVDCIIALCSYLWAPVLFTTEAELQIL